jgi:hypothetical protein
MISNVLEMYEFKCVGMNSYCLKRMNSNMLSKNHTSMFEFIRFEKYEFILLDTMVSYHDGTLCAWDRILMFLAKFSRLER